MVRIHDPRAIRALAHPARLAVLDALRDERTLTATEAAEIAGLSPSAMSYHLRALAKWGIIRAVEPDAGGDGRERRWRQAGRGLVMETSAAGAEAAGAMIATRYLDRDRDEVVQFLQRGNRESTFWRANATIGHSEGWMTEDEAMEIHDLIEHIQLAHRRHHGEVRPAGTRRVRTTFIMIPIDEPEAGNGGVGAS